MTLEELLRLAPIIASEARILMAHALQFSRVQLVTESKLSLSPEQVNNISRLFARRAQGEPIAYITGEREFYGLSFAVNPSVLIPRPETELLLELALGKLAAGASVLDLGTGSGAIAIALAHSRPDIQVTATDLSLAALDTAQSNAARHAVAVRFIHSNWYAQVQGKFDLVLSNPPYIAANDKHLEQEDLRFEPRSALTDEANGMLHLSAIISGAPALMKPGGCLLLEHGYDQASAVRACLLQAGWQQIESWKDLAGIERVTGAICPH